MADEAVQHADDVAVDEHWLYRQIVKKWGEYGAHAEVYRRVLELAQRQIDGWVCPTCDALYDTEATLKRHVFELHNDGDVCT